MSIPATIDGYWGLLKCGITGSYHRVSIKHLHRYLSEFQFRWNNRDTQNVFLLVIAALVIGAALPYNAHRAAAWRSTCWSGSNAGRRAGLDYWLEWNRPDKAKAKAGTESLFYCVSGHAEQ